MILTDSCSLRNLLPSGSAFARTQRRRCLENPWHVSATIEDGGKQRLVLRAQRKVMAVVAERAEVHLAETSAEPIEQLVGRVHRRIDRVSMRDVQAKGGVGQGGAERP